MAPGKNIKYKRPFDLTILTFVHLIPPLFVVWVLLWTIIPLLIWMEDRGPIFYKQKRVGKHGKVFTVIKFRTMVVDADTIWPPWTVEGDARITKVGRLLRKTALDELPELLSIWAGDMSLVGPRALSTHEQSQLESEIPGFVKRLDIRPGLTGLAQIQNRSDNADAKLACDLEYIQRMSIWLDFKLLFTSAWYTLRLKWDGRSGRSETRVN